MDSWRRESTANSDTSLLGRLPTCSHSVQSTIPFDKPSLAVAKKKGERRQAQNENEETAAVNKTQPRRRVPC